MVSGPNGKEWTHRGRLASSSGICYYARLRCDQFCGIVKRFGGAPKSCE